MKSKWIEHKDKRVFYSDFSGSGVEAQALREEGREVIATVTQEPLNSVLALSDVAGSVGTPENLAVMRSIVSKTTPHIRKRAVVGVSAAQRALLEIVNRITGEKKFSAFATAEQALDWLVAE
jgi:hypothetical protein